MIIIKKICQLIMIAVFMYLFNIHFSLAASTNDTEQKNFQINVTEINTQQTSVTYDSSNCDNKCSEGYYCAVVFGSLGKYTCIKKPETNATEAASEVTAGTSTAPSDAAITGCSSNYGLFSGLIATGSKIFNGLRDLIYVVAGFGIIGVAVGGFFGNLNWKWLGAIIISLVVIATTGEIINLITGCEDFSNAIITDTLTK